MTRTCEVREATQVMPTRAPLGEAVITQGRGSALGVT